MDKTTSSNFQKVLDFNKAFGVKNHDKPQQRIFIDDPKLVKYRLDLILEEVNELKDAIKNKDMKEVIDALCDINYVTYGMAASFGINLDDAFDIVHKSNMSKLCITKEEAQDTVKWYKENDKRYDSPTYRQSDNMKYWIVYNKSSGKILKNINYVPANFNALLKL